VTFITVNRIQQLKKRESTQKLSQKLYENTKPTAANTKNSTLETLRVDWYMATTRWTFLATILTGYIAQPCTHSLQDGPGTKIQRISKTPKNI